MIVASVVSLMVAVISEFGSAPHDTVRAPDAVSSLLEVFHNCDFDAVETTDLSSPSGLKLDTSIHLRGAICSDAVVVQRNTLAREIIGYKHNPQKPVTNVVSCQEDRWDRKHGRWQLELSRKLSDRWPSDAPQAAVSEVRGVFDLSQDDTDWTRVLQDTLLRELTGKLCGIGNLKEVTTGGELRYVLHGVQWAAADRRDRVSYDFRSPDYGSVTIVFSRLANVWRVSEIHITKTAENKMRMDLPEQAIRANGGDQKVARHNRFTGEFRNPGATVDRWESIYEIRYAPSSPRDRALPNEVTVTETGYSKDERFVLTKRLTFARLRSGAISAVDVQKLTLPLPDGCDVFRRNENIAWTTRDGELVKRIDYEALELGREMKMSSHPRVTFLLVVNGLMLAVIAGAFYARRRISRR